MSDRFAISTLINDGQLYYKVHDKESGKIVECNIGELKRTIWKLLGI